jgi:hypothetical protein
MIKFFFNIYYHLGTLLHLGPGGLGALGPWGLGAWGPGAWGPGGLGLGPVL